MNMIDAMPPGLYEVVLSEAQPGAEHLELVKGKHIARIEPRTLDDIRALGCNTPEDERKFEAVARVSEINQGLYRSFLGPAVKTMATPAAAKFLRDTHPNRVSFSGLSDKNPMMAPVAQMAKAIRAEGHRHQVSPDNPFAQYEKQMSAWIVTGLESFAKAREAWTEALFHGVYGSPALQAAVGLKSDRALSPHHASGATPQADASAELAAEMDRGGMLEAGLRAFLYVTRGGGADERQFNALEQIRAAAPENMKVAPSEMRSIIRRQARLLRADAPRALAAIPRMLPDDPSRRSQVVATLEKVVSARGAPSAETRSRLDEIRRLFGVAREAA
jgi:hypothetical protein